MDRIAQAALSKINLHLRVGAPRADGFHPLRSWMITTDLFDWIEFEPTAEPGVRLTCTDPSIPLDGTNLVTRAAEALLARADPSARIGLSIRLAKSIPAGAGLGGGSGNAATTLRAVNTLLGNRFTADELAAIALTLGSDVPFFLGKPSAVAAGRGEDLTPAPMPRARYAVLILPPFPIHTGLAYRRLDELRPAAPADLLEPFDVTAWARLPARELLAQLVNDLEAPAFAIEPRLGALRGEIEQRLGRVVRMSGSGSTLFSLFDTADESHQAADEVGRMLKLRAEAVELGLADIRHPAA